jgi:antitoxin ParD1/3/4
METGRSTLVVDLGEQLRVVEELVQNGSYSSPDQVIQAALRAFDGGDTEENALLTDLAERSLKDPRPSIPADEVFRSLRIKYGRPSAESAR